MRWLGREPRPPTSRCWAGPWPGFVGNEPVTFLRTPTQGPVLAHTAGETPSYTREIVPILYDYCAKCHRPLG